VLAGGKARFTQLKTAWLPESRAAYNRKLEEMLSGAEVAVPDEFKVNARRFLYFQLYLSSLPFDAFLKEDGVWKGYVTLKELALAELTPERSVTIKVILDGILKASSFEMPQ
jgi:hypothetical protein